MEKIINVSANCLKLGEHFECSGDATKFLHAYQDTGKVWTIGIGTTRYPDGTKVKAGDVITLDEAYAYYNHDITDAMQRVDALTVDGINQNMFDVLTDFVYNVGHNAYKTSHLRMVVNDNPENYAAVVQELLKWKYDNHVEQPGLLRRCKSRAYLYCYGDLKFYFSKTDKIY